MILQMLIDQQKLNVYAIAGDSLITAILSPIAIGKGSGYVRLSWFTGFATDTFASIKQISIILL